jgi:phosphoribosylformimino-5-aminoimidazole carboxamide ribonucleotide (ProFAR) isomerase
MDYGIEIYMPQLNSISIAKDGKSVTVGGGVNSKNMIDALWTAGKQTGKLSLCMKNTIG